MESTLTSDTQAVVLLCGVLGQRGGEAAKPLGLRQYNMVANWLKTAGLRPGDLLGREGRSRLKEFQSTEVNEDRLLPLLDRGAALALMVERWERSGLWVISRSDAAYPDRLKRYLGQWAPPVLYGVGSKTLLRQGGLAVVGSRDRSEEDGDFARRVGEQCAREGVVVISGAAKGIDRDAMTGGLEAGGFALGVLAEGLAKTATAGQYRAGLLNDRLTLVSPFDPDSRWLTYHAMERNKLLYGLSDAALVVASSADAGGTWSGATEALQNGRVRVFVKTTGTVAPGNLKLVRMGGTAFPAEPWADFPGLLKAPEATAVEGRSEPTAVTETGAVVGEVKSQPSSDAYTLVVETLLKLLDEPRAEEWVADRMSVRVAQVKDWLERGVQEGKVIKLKKPVRYVSQEPSLFDMGARS